MIEHENPFDAARHAVERAQRQLEAADSVAADMAILLVGRLRKIDSWEGKKALAAIKRELQDFNIQQEEWMR